MVSEGEEVGVLGSYMYEEGEGGRARSYMMGIVCGLVEPCRDKEVSRRAAVRSSFSGMNVF